MIKIAFKLLKVYKVYKYMQPTQQVYIKYFSVLAYFRRNLILLSLNILLNQ